MATKSKFHTQDGIKTLGNAEIDGSLTVSGNFTVNGEQTIIDSTTQSVTDSMIELASGNTTSDTIDVGIYGNYNDGLSGEGDVSEYTGLFRDATDSTWKLYDGLEVEPTTTVNTSGSGFTLADLQVGDLTATTLTATNSITGASITYPTTDGTNGQVITTNGSGTLTFGDIPAGYTDSDARSAISVSGDLSYNSSTGVISYSDSDTTYTDSDARSAISAGTGISYDSSTGVITNTVSNTDTTYSAGTGLSLTGTTFANTSPNIVQTTITGNAGTATTLQTARTINGVSFNGSANITVADSTKLPLAGGTMTGALTVSGVDQAIIAQRDQASNSGTWSARIVSRNQTTNGAAFLGNYQGYFGLFGHSYALDAWKEVYINRFGTSSNANTYIGTTDVTSLNVSGTTVIRTLSSNGITDNISYSGWPAIVINSDSSVILAEGFGSKHVGIGTTTDLGAKLNVADTNSTVAYFKMLGVAGGTATPLTSFQSSAAYSTHYLQAFYNSSGTRVGSVTIANGTATTVSFTTSSDYRLKENIDYTWDATSRLKDLKPARFSWIADDTNTLVDGFIAHEVSDIVPEAVAG